MKKVRAAGHVFDGVVSTGCGVTRRDVAIVVPDDTPLSVLEELRAAKRIEQLDEDETLVERVWQLTAWTKMEHVDSNFHTGIAVYWRALQEDDFDNLKNQVLSLASDNEDLMNAVLELASMLAEQKRNTED